MDQLFFDPYLLFHVMKFIEDQDVIFLSFVNRYLYSCSTKIRKYHTDLQAAIQKEKIKDYEPSFPRSLSFLFSRFGAMDTSCTCDYCYDNNVCRLFLMSTDKGYSPLSKRMIDKNQHSWDEIYDTPDIRELWIYN